MDLEQLQKSLQNYMNDRFGFDFCDQPNHPVRLELHKGSVVLTVFEGADGTLHEWYPSEKALAFAEEKANELLEPWGMIAVRDRRNKSAEQVQANAARHGRPDFTGGMV